MLCGGPKSLPVLHHGADYIVWSFGINELMFCCFKACSILVIHPSV